MKMQNSDVTLAVNTTHTDDGAQHETKQLRRVLDQLQGKMHTNEKDDTRDFIVHPLHD